MSTDNKNRIKSIKTNHKNILRIDDTNCKQFGEVYILQNSYLHSFFSSDRILNNVPKQLLIQNNPLELNSQRYIKCPYLLAANLHNC